MYRTICTIQLVLIVLFAALPARSDDNQPPPSTSLQFVQQFYDYYLPKALVPDGLTSTLDKRKADFDEPLSRALRDDIEAQAKATDEIVGLDFDPFLNSQDPAERYEVVSFEKKGGKYDVTVYEVRDGKRSEQPIVIPELTYNGHWRFVNFHYPNGDDLLTVLQSLKANRNSPAQ
jgi:hypothetical protein